MAPHQSPRPVPRASHLSTIQIKSIQIFLGWGRADFEQKRNLRTLFEVCLRIIQELEEVGGFSCSEASYGRVVLVWVIFASKLSVVDFNFSLRRAEPEPWDRERVKHAASDLFAKIGVIEPSFWFVLGEMGGGGGVTLARARGVFVVVMGGVVGVLSIHCHCHFCYFGCRCFHLHHHRRHFRNQQGVSCWCRFVCARMGVVPVLLGALVLVCKD